MLVVFLFILGLVMGSFLGAITYRLPRKIPLWGGKFGRSFCPNCKAKISWFDNIPVISFLILGGKCRSCKSKISLREPVIEILTGFVFTLSLFNSLFPFYIFLIFSSILIAITVIDVENQIIPDSLVWLGLGILLLWYFITNFEPLFPYLLSGLGTALLLLIVNLVTSGKGMGLGDVKLAIFIGSLLDLKTALVWLLVSFVIGASIGVILIVLKKANLKAKVPFAPFLIVGIFVISFFGSQLVSLFLPI